jgi:hypothetical protein
MAEAVITAAMEIAIAVEFTSRELRAVPLELCTASREVRAALAWTDACLSTAYRASCAHSAAASAHATTTTSAHAAASHTPAGTYMRAAAATAATATAVVLSQCRTGNCQTERQGCRAQNTEFRHHVSPQKRIEQNIRLARWFRFRRI